MWENEERSIRYNKPTQSWKKNSNTITSKNQTKQNQQQKQGKPQQTFTFNTVVDMKREKKRKSHEK